MQNHIPHAVEGLGQSFDLIVAPDIGTCLKIASCDAFNYRLQLQDRPDKAPRIHDRSEQTDQHTHDSQQAGAEIHLPRALIVGIQGQPDMNPSPFDAAVVEGRGVVEDPLLEHWHYAKFTPGLPYRGMPVCIDTRLHAPSLAIDDHG